MNLAYFSPLPPMKSGVADYSAALLPCLRPFFARIIAVVDGYAPSLPAGAVDEVVDVSVNPDGWRFDQTVPLYHMGGHPRFHASIYSALPRFPGVTVLHDGNLQPFFRELSLIRRDRAGFLRELGFEGGVGAIVAGARAIRRAEMPPDEYPMISRVARASLGIVVHSRFLRERVLRACPSARVAVVPFPDVLPDGMPLRSKSDAKASLGLAPDCLLVAAFGYVNRSKRLEDAIQAFARLRGQFPAARFVCVGEVVPGYPFDIALRRRGLRGVAHVTGYVSRDEFWRYLQATDIGVNLRQPAWGESSATLVSLLRCGVPTLVTDVGPFAELPDDVVTKVATRGDFVGEIERALGRLLERPWERGRIGEAARLFVAGQCRPEQVAQAYAAFIGSVVRNGARRLPGPLVLSPSGNMRAREVTATGCGATAAG